MYLFMSVKLVFSSHLLDDIVRPVAAAVDRYLLPARRSAANPPQRREAGK